MLRTPIVCNLGSQCYVWTGNHSLLSLSLFLTHQTQPHHDSFSRLASSSPCLAVTGSPISTTTHCIHILPFSPASKIKHLLQDGRTPSKAGHCWRWCLWKNVSVDVSFSSPFCLCLCPCATSACSIHFPLCHSEPLTLPAIALLLTSTPVFSQRAPSQR